VRVSTDSQSVAAQTKELRAAGAGKVFRRTATDGKRAGFHSLAGIWADITTAHSIFVNFKLMSPVGIPYLRTIFGRFVFMLFFAGASFSMTSSRGSRDSFSIIGNQ
jgi:hypothetical protein